MSSRCAAHRNCVPSALSRSSGYCMLHCPESGVPRVQPAKHVGVGVFASSLSTDGAARCKRFSPLRKSTEVRVSIPLVQTCTFDSRSYFEVMYSFRKPWQRWNRDVGCTRRFMYTHCCTLNACTPSDRRTHREKLPHIRTKPNGVMQVQRCCSELVQ